MSSRFDNESERQACAFPSAFLLMQFRGLSWAELELDLGHIGLLWILVLSYVVLEQKKRKALPFGIETPSLDKGCSLQELRCYDNV